MLRVITAIMVLCGGVYAIEWHFTELRRVQVEALLNANERILESQARLWHCSHLLDGCLQGRYCERDYFNKR